MTPQRTILGVATLIATVVALHWLASSPPEPARDRRPIATSNWSAQLPRITSPDTEPTAAPNRLQEVTKRLSNPLELSSDLRAIYDQFKDSADEVERHAAYRAWSACFPTLIAPQGQPISIEHLTRALPPSDPNHAARVDAYRSLQARCRNFSDMTREQTLDATRRQQEAAYTGAILSPGEIAAKHLTDGNKEAALTVARSIIASRDPYAISSLREFINHYVVLQVDAQIEPSTERPDLRSLAFSLAACQMGLECGPTSLTALQMCASLGECSGTVTERYLRALPSQADRDALQAETRRVGDAIQSDNYSALGL